MIRSTALIALAAWTSVALAQTPEVAVFGDLRIGFLVEDGDRAVFRLYDPEGYPSTVGFRMYLESGNRMLVSQRLQNFGGTGDTDNLDEYWIESTGVWRLGKQYLPFGSRTILRDTVPAARFDTNLMFDGIPITVAYGDGGPGRTRGVVARVGRSDLGVSVATGNHFGIQPTSLTPVQLPKESLGKGRGYALAYGADFRVHAGSATIEAEWVSLRNGETPLDVIRDISDVRFNFFLPGRPADKITFGWTRSWDSRETAYRIQGDFAINHKSSWGPYVRYRDGGLKDAGLTVHYRF